MYKLVLKRAAVVGLNGGSCIQTSLEPNRLPGTECQCVNETNAAGNSGMTPVNRKAGMQESARGSY